MKVTRRGLLPALAAGLTPAQAQQTAAPCVVGVSQERARALAPVLARRKTQLDALRAVVIEDGIGPTPGLPRR
ncbi:MAG: hypothetical protein JNK87_03965 [Bryobacterales bacterium]|nr:hypothetical protein [Bryobacterales bacterium]